MKDKMSKYKPHVHKYVIKYIKEYNLYAPDNCETFYWGQCEICNRRTQGTYRKYKLMNECYNAKEVEVKSYYE